MLCLFCLGILHLVRVIGWYFFTSLGDLTGILVLRGVMDTAWLEHSNHVLDLYEHDPARAWSATDVVAEREGGSAALLSTQQQ
eukprot:COSAG06_NODE_18012_length_908_cov_2.336218_1_plen_83_part_00